MLSILRATGASQSCCKRAMASCSRHCPTSHRSCRLAQVQLHHPSRISFNSARYRCPALRLIRSRSSFDLALKARFVAPSSNKTPEASCDASAVAYSSRGQLIRVEPLIPGRKSPDAFRFARLQSCVVSCRKASELKCITGILFRTPTPFVTSIGYMPVHICHCRRELLLPIFARGTPSGSLCDVQKHYPLQQ